MKATCGRCDTKFEARRKTAKWCSERCRKAAGRARLAGDVTPPPADDSAPPVDEPEVPSDDTGLVKALRQELETAGCLETVLAQQALVLAKAMTKVDASGISGLSKELSRVKAEALDAAPTPKSQEPPEGDPDDEDDEVKRARRRREEKAAAAAGGSS